jgi:hypothetical protein
VAEVFISANFRDIKLYKEFEVSPQGEWIDLDIDLRKPHHEVGWTWNSGFEKTAHRYAHRWYTALRIPFSAIDHRSAKAGNMALLTAREERRLDWALNAQTLYSRMQKLGISRADPGHI